MKRKPRPYARWLDGHCGSHPQAGMCILALLLLAVPASAQNISPWGPADRGFVFDLSEYTVVIGHAMDLASTVDCRSAGRCREANPFLARFDNPLTFTAAKFAVGGLGLWAVRKMQPRHPRLASVVNYAIGAGFVSLGIRNARVGR
jgi:hypothetical protein